MSDKKTKINWDSKKVIVTIPPINRKSRDMFKLMCDYQGTSMAKVLLPIVVEQGNKFERNVKSGKIVLGSELQEKFDKYFK